MSNNLDSPKCVPLILSNLFNSPNASPIISLIVLLHPYKKNRNIIADIIGTIILVPIINLYHSQLTFYHRIVFHDFTLAFDNYT